MSQYTLVYCDRSVQVGAGLGVAAGWGACWARSRSAGTAWGGGRQARRAVGAQAEGAQGDRRAGAGRSSRGLGARAGLGLRTRCTRLVFGPVQLGIFLSQNFFGHCS